jgi:hypothetical protein
LALGAVDHIFASDVEKEQLKALMRKAMKNTIA